MVLRMEISRICSIRISTSGSLGTKSGALTRRFNLRPNTARASSLLGSENFLPIQTQFSQRNFSSSGPEQYLDRSDEPKTKPKVLVKQCGRVSYSEGLKLQKCFVEKHLKTIQSSPGKSSATDENNTLLLLEHAPVYTVGLRSSVYSKEEEERLLKLGAEFHRTDRGGLITFHGPGQLVAYPILDLTSFNRTGQIRWYVSQLEKTLIRTCMMMGIPQAGTSPHTGVWVGSNLERKIAAIGIHVSEKRITNHGVALNCDTDMSWFKSIVPCGIADREVTSLSQELDRHVSISDVQTVFSNAFAETFNCRVEAENIS